MSKSNKDSMKSHLENLMAHILKWKNQISKRTPSWAKTILNARGEIKRLQKKQPSLNDKYLEKIFEETLEKARKAAENEMQEPVKDSQLTWYEVFKNPYILSMILIALLIGIWVWK